MNSQTPITQNSEICDILSCIPEKFVVDFANGIHVTNDHLNVQKNRGNFFARCYDGFTGQGKQRQTDINQNLLKGVEGALTMLTELTHSLASSTLAITQINHRVDVIQKHLTTLANYAADTQEQLDTLANHLNTRCDLLFAELYRVDFEQRAERHLSQTFNKWKAGHFNAFSLIGRFYAVLETLNWGDFGDYCRIHNNAVKDNFLADLSNRAITQLVEDAQVTPTARLETYHWLQQPTQTPILSDGVPALAYMGDWANPTDNPFVFSTTRSPDTLPLYMPKICHAERISHALITEVFNRAA